MLASLVFFAVRLSFVDLIGSQFTARERRSNKARSVPERAIVMEEGERVHAYQLRGYIFFGSVYTLADHLKKSLSGDSRPACLMLDFAAISGFDFSAVSVLCRFLKTANAAGVTVVLSTMSDPLRTGLERNLPPSVLSELHIEPNADRGLERCEEIVIAAWRADVKMAEERRVSLLEHTAEDLERYLERKIHSGDLIEELQSWLDPRQYSAGESLTGSGAPRDGLQLLLSGRASACDSAGARLYECSPGDAIWPVDPFDEKATSVVANEPCRTMVLTPGARRWLDEHEERLALKLYRYLLAGRFQTESGAGKWQKFPTAERIGLTSHKRCKDR